MFEESSSLPPSSSTLISRVNGIVYALNRIKSDVINFRQERAVRHNYTLSIDASDRFYYQLQVWLLTQIKNDNQRSVKCYSDNHTLVYHFDDSNSNFIEIDGHEISVTTQKPKSSVDNLRAELFGDETESILEPRVVFVAKSESAFAALKKRLAEVKEETSKKKSDPPRIFYSTNFYSDHSMPLRARPLDSVILAEGQMNRIVEDLERFLDSEQIYIDRGVPYQRGYLFHGPPGTGKTSLAKALAGHFHLDIHYISLGIIHGDGDLLKSVSNISERSIVLFEDVDVFRGVKDREEADNEKGPKFSLSGFLNIMDGILTPHGLIKMLTTNVKDVIDPAVLRPGRIDLIEELGLMYGKQSDKLFYSFYKQSPHEPLMLEGVAPSDMIEIMKVNMFDPDTAETEIRKAYR